MQPKPSAIFEGENSSLKKTFEEATKPIDWEEEFYKRFNPLSQHNLVEIKSFISTLLSTQREEVIKQIEEKLPSIKEEIKPDSYHFFCYGGSTIKLIDERNEKDEFNCGRKGKIDWSCPACEKCNGRIKGDYCLNEYQEIKNDKIKEYNSAISEVRSIIISLSSPSGEVK